MTTKELPFQPLEARSSNEYAQIFHSLHNGYGEPQSEFIFNQIKQGKSIVFFLGLAGSGKTTLINQMAEEINHRYGENSPTPMTTTVIRFDTYYKAMQKEYGETSANWTPKIWEKLAKNMAFDIIKARLYNHWELQQNPHAKKRIILVETVGVGDKDRGRTALKLVYEAFQKLEEQEVFAIGVVPDPRTGDFAFQVRQYVESLDPSNELELAAIQEMLLDKYRLHVGSEFFTLPKAEYLNANKETKARVLTSALILREIFGRMAKPPQLLAIQTEVSREVKRLQPSKSYQDALEDWLTYPHLQALIQALQAEGSKWGIDVIRTALDQQFGRIQYMENLFQTLGLNTEDYRVCVSPFQQTGTIYYLNPAGENLKLHRLKLNQN